MHCSRFSVPPRVAASAGMHCCMLPGDGYNSDKTERWICPDSHLNLLQQIKTCMHPSPVPFFSGKQSHCDSQPKVTTKCSIYEIDHCTAFGPCSMYVCPCTCAQKHCRNTQSPAVHIYTQAQTLANPTATVAHTWRLSTQQSSTDHA